MHKLSAGRHLKDIGRIDWYKLQLFASGPTETLTAEALVAGRASNPTRQSSPVKQPANQTGVLMYQRRDVGIIRIAGDCDLSFLFLQVERRDKLERHLREVECS